MIVLLHVTGELSGVNEENAENENDERNVEQQIASELAGFLGEDNENKEPEQEAEQLTASRLPCIVANLKRTDRRFCLTSSYSNKVEFIFHYAETLKRRVRVARMQLLKH